MDDVFRKVARITRTGYGADARRCLTPIRPFWSTAGTRLSRVYKQTTSTGRHHERIHPALFIQVLQYCSRSHYPYLLSATMAVRPRSSTPVPKTVWDTEEAHTSERNILCTEREGERGGHACARQIHAIIKRLAPKESFTTAYLVIKLTGLGWRLCGKHSPQPLLLGDSKRVAVARTAIC